MLAGSGRQLAGAAAVAGGWRVLLRLAAGGPQRVGQPEAAAEAGGPGVGLCGAAGSVQRHGLCNATPPSRGKGRPGVGRGGGSKVKGKGKGKGTAGRGLQVRPTRPTRPCWRRWCGATTGCHHRSIGTFATYIIKLHAVGKATCVKRHVMRAAAALCPRVLRRVLPCANGCVHCPPPFAPTLAQGIRVLMVWRERDSGAAEGGR